MQASEAVEQAKQLRRTNYDAARPQGAVCALRPATA